MQYGNITKEFEETINNLYEDTKRLREHILNNSELKKKIIEYFYMKEYGGYMYNLRENKLEEYKKLIRKVTNGRYEDIFYMKEDWILEVLSAIKDKLPHSKEIINFGHNRIFYALDKVNLDKESYWLGYKKTISKTHFVGGINNSVNVREIEGLCNYDSKYEGRNIPKFYLMIYEDSKAYPEGIITQDLSQNKTKAINVSGWKVYVDGEQYFIDAKHYAGFNREYEFNYGAKLFNLAIDVKDLK